MGSETSSKIAQAGSKSDLSSMRKLAVLCLSQSGKLNFVILPVITLHTVNILLYFCPIGGLCIAAPG